MGKNIKELKDEIQKLVGKNKWDKALEACRELFKLDKGDMANIKRIGDLSMKIGDRTNAIRAYEVVGRNFMQSGFEIKAVAIAKILQEIDPDNEWAAGHLEAVVQPAAPAPAAKAGAAPAPAAVEDESEKTLTLDDEEIELKPRLSPEEMKRHGVGLVTNELFSGFTPQECLKVLTKMRLRRFEPGEAICKEGDGGDSIMLISDGQVEVVKSGKRVTVLSTGTFFGEFGFFQDKKRHADVKATEPTDILEITKKDFEEIIDEFPNVADVLVRIYKLRVLDLVLAMTNLFESLDTPSRLAMLDHFELATFKKGAAIIQEGEAGDAMYIIKDGSVEVSTNSGGKKVVLATLQEGDYFGEGSLVTGKPRTASVTALENVAAMKMDKVHFNNVIAKYPAVKSAAESTVVGRAKNTIEQLLSSEENLHMV